MAHPRRAEAHDVALTSIARLFLDEIGQHRYLLSILDTYVPPIVAGPDLLPPTCRMTSGASAGTQVGGGNDAADGAVSEPSGQEEASAAHEMERRFNFGFECDQALTFDDLITLRWPLSGVVVLAHWSDGTDGSAFFRGNGKTIPIRLGELRAGAASKRRLAAHYVALGCQHILFGVDHLLFVAGLLLLVHGFGALVRTVTAFTVAHSITLAAAVLGWIPVDRAPVEAAIALSIVLLAREIVMGHRGHVHLAHRWPWLVAFAFGLLHGLGFAGALGALGLRPHDIPLALLSFNIGVEIGQLSFVAVLIAVAYGARRLVSASRGMVFEQAVIVRLPPALGYLVGVLSTVWLFQRLPAVLGW